MVLMAHSLKGIYPNQLSFGEASTHIIFKLSQLLSISPGNVPKVIFDLEKDAKQFILEGKRERSYSRELKCSKNRYPIKKNAVHVK